MATCLFEVLWASLRYTVYSATWILNDQLVKNVANGWDNCQSDRVNNNTTMKSNTTIKNKIQKRKLNIKIRCLQINQTSEKEILLKSIRGRLEVDVSFATIKFKTVLELKRENPAVFLLYQVDEAQIINWSGTGLACDLVNFYLE